MILFYLLTYLFVDLYIYFDFSFSLSLKLVLFARIQVHPELFTSGIAGIVLKAHHMIRNEVSLISQRYGIIYCIM